MRADVRRRAGGAERRRQGLQRAHLLERAASARGHRVAAQPAGREPLVGHRDAVLAHALRLVERRVGGHEQVAQRLPVLREATATPIETERRQPSRSMAASARCRRRQTVRAFDFVVSGRSSANSSPPSAVGAVVRPHAVGEQAPDHAQRVVAGHVAAAVVEVLEVVEVGDHHREARVRGARRVEQRGAVLVEAAVVRQAGQRVRQRRGDDVLVALQVAQRRAGLRREQLRALVLVGLELAARCARRPRSGPATSPPARSGSTMTDECPLLPHGAQDRARGAVGQRVGRLPVQRRGQRHGLRRLAARAGERIVRRHSRRGSRSSLRAGEREHPVEAQRLADQARGQLQQRARVARRGEPHEGARQLVERRSPCGRAARGCRSSRPARRRTPPARRAATPAAACPTSSTPSRPGPAGSRKGTATRAVTPSTTET